MKRLLLSVALCASTATASGFTPVECLQMGTMMEMAAMARDAGWPRNKFVGEMINGGWVIGDEDARLQLVKWETISKAAYASDVSGLLPTVMGAVATNHCLRGQ